jgi:hypothetical protein
LVTSLLSLAVDRGFFLCHRHGDGVEFVVEGASGRPVVVLAGGDGFGDQMGTGAVEGAEGVQDLAVEAFGVDAWGVAVAGAVAAAATRGRSW